MKIGIQKRWRWHDHNCHWGLYENYSGVRKAGRLQYVFLIWLEGGQSIFVGTAGGGCFNFFSSQNYVFHSFWGDIVVLKSISSLID